MKERHLNIDTLVNTGCPRVISLFPGRLSSRAGLTISLHLFSFADDGCLHATQSPKNDVPLQPQCSHIYCFYLFLYIKSYIDIAMELLSLLEE